MKLACCNIRTILDKTGSNRPAPRSALIADELFRLYIDIAALSEVHLLEKSSQSTRAWRRVHSFGLETLQEKLLSGVGFMLRTSIASKLENLSYGHSDRIMPMHLPLENNKYVKLISVYAPTLEAFYNVTMKDKKSKKFMFLKMNLNKVWYFTNIQIGQFSMHLQAYFHVIGS